MRSDDEDLWVAWSSEQKKQFSKSLSIFDELQEWRGVGRNEGFVGRNFNVDCIILLRKRRAWHVGGWHALRKRPSAYGLSSFAPPTGVKSNQIRFKLGMKAYEAILLTLEC